MEAHMNRFHSPTGPAGMARSIRNWIFGGAGRSQFFSDAGLRADRALNETRRNILRKLSRRLRTGGCLRADAWEITLSNDRLDA